MNEQKKDVSMSNVKDFIASKNAVPGIFMWPEANVDDITNSHDSDLTSGLSGVVFDYIRSMSSFSRFPVSSSFLTMMGAVATLTARCVWTQPYYKSDKALRPLTLYTAVGAGSGSGKSTIHGALFKPISRITGKREKALEKRRGAIEYDIVDKSSELKLLRKRHADSNMNTIPEFVKLKREVLELRDSLEQIKPTIWNMAEYNLQKVATTAADQNGYVAIHSDENDTIDFITGAKAGIETSIMRKAFDGSEFTYGKTGLDIQIDNVVAGICLMGQTNILDLIWGGSKKMGGMSNGLMERFFVLIERGVVGRKSEMPRGEPPTDLHEAAWSTLVNNLINVSPITLIFSDTAKKYMDDIHLKYDSRCSEGDVFATEPMLGMVSKSTAHIANLSGILHVIKEWSVDLTAVRPPDAISDETVKQASKIFSELVSSHLKMLTAKGIVGVNVRAKEIREAVSSLVSSKRKRIFSNSEIQQAAGGRAIFRTGKKLTSSELFEVIYPSLEIDNVLCVVGKKIYINPHFA